KLHAQLYTREYETVFTPWDGRAYAVYGRHIFQSRLESESIGLRLDLETPLPNRMTLFWGADAGSEETAQPVWIMDPEVYDESGGRTFRTIGDRTFVPLIDKRNAAGFAQLEWLMSDRWLLRTGIRHEDVTADIPTFTTLGDVTIGGGERNWADTLFNAGLVFYPTPDQRIWTSFSQGFSLPDIGLVLRSAPVGASLDTLPFQPQIVDAWEIGWSRESGSFAWEIATFYNTSEFGTSTAGFNQPVVRAPERVYGIEGAFEVDPAGPWSFRLNAAWNEGKSDPDRDGDYTWLNAYRISPPNATLGISHETTARWRNRLSVSWSGDRERFGDSSAFGRRPIESYTVVDLFSSIRLMSGELQIGIRNLLNEDYFMRDAQLLRSGFNNSHSAAPGATLDLGWSIRY
ncbi:MAG: TonB-dependent receptor, partial [Thermoanaerobaculia bacterium]|nr:TonB-dependent receptor [Thermoanaerobaculia bacterium]